jgi:hypothetical protein
MIAMDMTTRYAMRYVMQAVVMTHRTIGLTALYNLLTLGNLYIKLPPLIERKSANGRQLSRRVVVPRRSLLLSVWQDWFISDVVAQRGTQLMCLIRQDLVDRPDSPFIIEK